MTWTKSQKQEWSRNYYRKNKLKILKRLAEYREKFPEKRATTLRKYTQSEKGKQCRNRYKKSHTEKIREQGRKDSKKRILFKNKRIYLGFNPRTGICSNCGKEGITNLHHKQYHEDDPLKDTLELCTSCHLKKHPEVSMSRIYKK